MSVIVKQVSAKPAQRTSTNHTSDRSFLTTWQLTRASAHCPSIPLCALQAVDRRRNQAGTELARVSNRSQRRSRVHVGIGSYSLNPARSGAEPISPPEPTDSRNNGAEQRHSTGVKKARSPVVIQKGPSSTLVACFFGR